MEQLTLLARNATDDALDTVARGAGKDWIASAYSYLARYATNHARFLIDDVRRAAQETGLVEPHDARAWGVVARMAMRAQLVTEEGYAPVTRVCAHARPMRVWKSLVFNDQDIPAQLDMAR